MRKTILEIQDGQCRFPVTDDHPFFFCGEVTALDRVYCDVHHAICNTGFGKDPRAIEEMMRNAEHTVLRRRPTDETPHTQAVDQVMK